MNKKNIFPDLTKGQKLAANTPAPFDGWLIAFIRYSGNNTAAQLTLDGTLIAIGGQVSSATMWNNLAVQIPIQKGQVYTISGGATLQENSTKIYPFVQ